MSDSQKARQDISKCLMSQEMEIKDAVSLKWLILDLVSWDVPSSYVPEMAFLSSYFNHA